MRLEGDRDHTSIPAHKITGSVQQSLMSKMNAVKISYGHATQAANAIDLYHPTQARIVDLLVDLIDCGL